MSRGTITIVGFNRPEMLQRTLVYLARCQGIEDYTVLGYTHGPEHKETMEIFRNMRVGRQNYCIIGKDPGPIWTYSRVSIATKDALDLGFNTSDFVIHLEEDVLLAPDALKYFEWVNERYRNSPSVYAATAFGDRNFPPHLPYAVRKFNGFTSWGWGTWDNRWDDLSKQWDLWEWDRGLKEYIRGERSCVMPLLSRSKTIGAVQGVTNASPHLEEWANDVALPPKGVFYEVEERRRDY